MLHMLMTLWGYLNVYISTVGDNASHVDDLVGTLMDTMTNKIPDYGLNMIFRYLSTPFLYNQI
jgi:hypothetical protein